MGCGRRYESTPCALYVDNLGSHDGAEQCFNCEAKVYAPQADGSFVVGMLASRQCAATNPSDDAGGTR